MKILKIINEINLLNNSGLFNTTYYRAYYKSYLQILKYIRINPSLHYLLIGGRKGFDPGPNFDSSWYINHYSDVKQTGLNPLIHFLKFGIMESRATYSLKPGRHIEFIGLNGSGKTTLYFEANKYLRNYLGYHPGPSKVWTGMVSDVRMKAIGNFTNNLIDYLTDNYSFIYDVLNAKNQIYQPDFIVPELPRLSITYFLILCSYYHAVKFDRTKPWCMFDEGFCSNLKNIIVNVNGRIDNAVSKRILSQMPKPDLLIYINTDVISCLSRMRDRKNGIPKPYRHLSESEYKHLLSERAMIIERFLDLIRNSETKVVKINNNVSLKKSTSEVIKAISTLYDQSNFLA